MTPSSDSRNQKVPYMSKTVGQGFNKKGNAASKAAENLRHLRNGRQSAIEYPLNHDIE